MLTVSYFAAAEQRVDALPEFARLAADWKTAFEIGQNGHARGRLLLLIGG